MTGVKSELCSPINALICVSPSHQLIQKSYEVSIHLQGRIAAAISWFMYADTH